MNKKIIFPNNPLFFLQFVFLPALLAYIAAQLGVTVHSAIETLGILKIMILVIAYIVFIIGMVFNAIVVISEDSISGPGTEANFFPVKHPLIGSECTVEYRRTGKLNCESLIIRHKYNPGEICLPNVYFSYDLFDEITNLIRIANKQI